jgi:cell division protein ZipA
LVLALRSAELRHGQFGIFHAHPEGSPDVTVFSVASLTEPGSFDLTALKTGRYPGVSLFMALPGPLDGVTAFDRMVACARQLASDLDGELSDEQGSTLSVQRQRYLREEVIHFQHGAAVG